MVTWPNEICEPHMAPIGKPSMSGAKVIVCSGGARVANNICHRKAAKYEGHTMGTQAAFGSSPSGTGTSIAIHKRSGSKVDFQWVACASFTDHAIGIWNFPKFGLLAKTFDNLAFCSTENQLHHCSSDNMCATSNRVQPFTVKKAFITDLNRGFPGSKRVDPTYKSIRKTNKFIVRTECLKGSPRSGFYTFLKRMKVPLKGKIQCERDTP